MFFRSSLYMFFFLCYGHRLVLHSFPTRRSSDLACLSASSARRRRRHRSVTGLPPSGWSFPGTSWTSWRPAPIRRRRRSEEHTSELQSHSDLVCRLLLEKKKKNTKRTDRRIRSQL